MNLLIGQYKKTIQRLFAGWFFIFPFTVLALTASYTKDKERHFVSLTLCSDRLLMALAAPSQISAVSPYSLNKELVITPNVGIPTVKAQLSQLLPYINATILVNGNFYPRLVKRLKQLNFNVININDSPKTPEELIALIKSLGVITGHTEKSQKLITQINEITQWAKESPLTHKNQQILLLGEGGLMNGNLPQYKTLMHLIGASSSVINTQKSKGIPLEKLVLTPPDNMITFQYNVNASGGYYSDANQWLSHPAIMAVSQMTGITNVSAKYTYCFDHGVWLGAKAILQQWKEQQLSDNALD